MAVFFQDCGKDSSGAVIFVEDDIAVMSHETPAKETLVWLEERFPDAAFSIV